MAGKRATKPVGLLTRETFNDMQRRIEQLEARLSQLYQPDHQSQLLVRNSQSSDWPQFAVVQLLSPIPATGLHFNESKLISAEITPDLHTYDPDTTYGVVQYKVPKISNSVPGAGPGVVTGLTSALFVAGADDSLTFAKPATESGKFDTTTDPTPFRVIGIDASTNVGKIVIQCCCDAAAGSGGSNDSCCCPDGALKLAMPAPGTLTPSTYGIITDKRIAYTSGDYVTDPGPNQGTLSHTSEVNEPLIEDGTIIRFTSKLKLVQAGTGLLRLQFPQFYWSGYSVSPPYPAELLSVPPNFTTGYPSALTNPSFFPIEAHDGIWDDSGTDTLTLEWLVRINDASVVSSPAPFGLSGYVQPPTGNPTYHFDIFRYYLACVNGEPDPNSGEPGGGGGPSL